MLKKGLVILFFMLSSILVYSSCCSNISKNYHSFYNNGKIYERGDLHNGMRQGEWLVFYENGNIKEKIVYKDNKKNGEYFSFYENGQLKYRAIRLKEILLPLMKVDI